MTTYTLTESNPEEVFNIAEDGDVQVIVAQESVFNGALFKLYMETDVSEEYIQIPNTSTSVPTSDLYSFKAGNLKAGITGANSKTNIIVDIR